MAGMAAMIAATIAMQTAVAASCGAVVSANTIMAQQEADKRNKERESEQRDDEQTT